MSALPQSIPQVVNEITGQKPKRISILERAVLVRVRLSRVGTQRKLNNSAIEVESDKRYIRATKVLMDSPELSSIDEIDNAIKADVRRYTLPSCLDEGLYAISVEEVPGGPLVARFEDAMRQYEMERKRRVEAFADAIETIKANDKQRLGPNYKETDYPTRTAILETFSFTWNYLSLEAPRSLERVSQELYDAAKAQIAKDAEDAADAIRMALRAEMKKLVDHITERLSPGADGKRKVFRDSLTGNITDFLELFDGRNITNDAELKALAERARSLITGITPEVLRDSDGMREMVRGGFEEIKQSLDAAMETEGRRLIEVV